MSDLVFEPMYAVCPECNTRIQTSIEALEAKDEHVCPKCQTAFTPDVDVKNLLELMKAAENRKQN